MHPTWEGGKETLGEDLGGRCERAGKLSEFGDSESFLGHREFIFRYDEKKTRVLVRDL